MMIKQKFSHERFESLENDTNLSSVIKLNLSKQKYHYIIGNYRQWKGSAPLCRYNSRLDEDCQKRFQDMIKIWEKVLEKKKPTLILGDISIDRMECNDPESRQYLKNLIPIMETFQKDNNVVLVIKKPPKHRINQRSTLLDLVLANKPDIIKIINNVNNHCSEHDGIYTLISSKSTTTNVQFVNRRNTKNLTPENLDEHIKNNYKLQLIFNKSEPTKIAET